MDIYAFILTPWFWLALMVVFILIELACSFNLITIWFALSSFLMIFISGLTELLDSPVIFRLHLGIFISMAILLLIFTRPIVIRKFKVGKIKTNVDDLINKDALIVKSISKFGKGEIKIQGQIWTAISDDDNEIAENTECVIVRIEGVKAVVRKK